MQSLYEGDKDSCQNKIIVQFTIYSKLHYLASGTDGHRVLCRQFYTSSLHPQANCIKSSNTFLLKMKKLRKAILLLSSTDAQGQETRHIVFPLPDGRRCYIVL